MIRKRIKTTKREPPHSETENDRELWFWAMDIAVRQRDSIDRALLTIATGAIGVSLILASDVPQFSLQWIFVSGSIVAELIAIFMVISSHRRSASGYERYAEKQTPDPMNNKTIQRRNQWAVACVIIGVIAAFVAFSLPMEDSQDGQERTGQAATQATTEIRSIEDAGRGRTKTPAS